MMVKESRNTHAIITSDTLVGRQQRTRELPALLRRRSSQLASVDRAVGA